MESNSREAGRYNVLLKAAKCNNQTKAALAKELGTSRTSLYRWQKKWDQYKSLADEPKVGRKRKLSAEHLVQLRTLVGEKTTESSRSLAAQLSKDIGGGVSPVTVRRRLKEEGSMALLRRFLC